MLQIQDLTYRVGGRLLLDRASVTIPAGHRAAIVGRNGTGKSTLLKLIAGDLQADGGTVSVPTGVRIGMVAQEAPSGDATLLETVLAADKERSALLAEAEAAEDPVRIGEIHARLSDIDAHGAPARAAQILAGLGFDHAAQQRPCSDFSGGWRMRVALAGVLFAAPDLLLLDEPTNHLDLEATVWLQNFLRGYPHTLLIVSHDRDLLNAVPTTTVHLDQMKLTAYAGGFDQFERTRRANLERLEALRTKQEQQRRHMQAFVDRFRYKASKARQAQSRIKALERMQPIAEVLGETPVRFDFPSPGPVAPPLITLDRVAIGYGDRPVLRNIGLRIDPDDRIALLGANGNGKSTLIKLLAGRLAPMSGEMHRPGKLKIGYFAQHQADEFDLSATALAFTARHMPDAPEEKVRAHLGRFGFPQDRAETRIGDMSGGEKARLLFALMSREAPHILLLDEPTNHLDIQSREALVEAINGFEGAVIVISHDPHLIRLTADRLWLVADGTAKPFDGDLEDYERLLLDQRRTERAEGRDGQAAGPNRRDQRRNAAELRAQLAPLRKAAQDAEKLVDRLTAQRKTLSDRLADPALYAGPADAVTRLQIELGELDKRLADAEETWLSAQEALESAAAELGAA
ncbi:MAG TPA: ATP-binding cassette domain-containing protein [Azospirillaceae bacterium]|nr:ATP-binding cassette domain-containing protein [Azospirillaceae bacterium]